MCLIDRDACTYTVYVPMNATAIHYVLRFKFWSTQSSSELLVIPRTCTCAVLLCLVCLFVCLTLLASFFLPSHLSLKHVRLSTCVASNHFHFQNDKDVCSRHPLRDIFRLLFCRMFIHVHVCLGYGWVGYFTLLFFLISLS